MNPEEIMEYMKKHGEPPRDNLSYVEVDPMHLEEVLENCIVFTVLEYADYTEILFRHINNVDWYSLHIKGAKAFEVARFTVQPGKESGYSLIEK